MKKTDADSHAGESEEQLVGRAQEAVSQCRWVVGECAARWTERYARGRTDGDFAALIGLSADQVFQRRRVWETFAGSREQFPKLKWSHFYAALNWDDAADCLRWADETHSTVAEMRAWRRAQRGEDLSVDAPEEEAIQFIPQELERVQVPGGRPAGGGESRGAAGPRGEAPAEHELLAGVARQSGDDDYTPYRTGATTPPPRELAAEPASAVAEPPSTEQLVKSFAGRLERFVKIMTPEFRREFRKLPEELRLRFKQAVDDFQEHVAELS